MSQAPLLSIVTTVFQDADGLKKTCRSLERLLMHRLDWEHVIVDSSPSENQTWVHELKEKAWPVHWVCSPPQGVYSAMNLGLESSRGKYIWFLNSGDKMTDPEALLNALREIQLQGADILCGSVFFGFPGGGKEKKIHSHLVQNLLGENRICHQACLFSSEIFKKLGKYNTQYRLAADYEFLWKSVLDSRIRVMVYLGSPFAVFYAGGRSSRFADVLNEFRKVHRSLKMSFKWRVLNAMFWEKARIRIQAVIWRDRFLRRS